jgi:serine/alanine adding enzyme
LAGSQACGATDYEGGQAMRPANDAELAIWDELITANPDGGNSLQTKSWGDFKAHYGWKPMRFVYTVKGRDIAVQVLTREVPFLGNILYCPKGPGVDSLDQFLDIVAKTKTASPNALFIRFEPELLDDLVDKQYWLRLVSRRAATLEKLLKQG